MAEKKTKATSARKKKSPAKKSAVSRTAGKVVTKAKKVLGEMMAGAAVGAVKGAAEAVLPDKDKADQKPKSGK